MRDNRMPVGQIIILLTMLSGLIFVRLMLTESTKEVIAFSVAPEDGIDGEIFLINVDGSNLRRLTDNTVDDRSPAWSPDGQKLAFESHKADSKGGSEGYEIYVMNADGTNRKQLTDNIADDRFPAWSPDGSQIVFASDRADNLNSDIYRGGRTQLYIMNSDGTNTRQLTSGTSSALFPTWSPDGQEITFTLNENGRNIYLMNADGTNVRQLTFDGDYNTNSIWSPDGQYIAFYSDRDSEEKIYLMNTDGSNQHAIIEGSQYGISWSPDGHSIVFEDVEHAISSLYIMNLESGNKELLVPNGWMPSWRPWS